MALYRDIATSPWERASPLPGKPGLLGSRPAVRIRRIGMSVSLVAIPDAVPIAVHADALAGAGRHAGIRHGEFPGQRPQRRVGDGRLPAPVGHEQARSHVEEAGLVVVDPGLGDEIALPRLRPLAQEV